MSTKKNKPLLYILLSISIIAFILVTFPSINISNMFAITGNVVGGNLVKNPGFETLDSVNTAYPQYWTPSGTDATHTIFLDDTEFKSGTNSIRYSIFNSTKSWFTIKGDKIVVSPNKQYMVEFYVKSEDLPVLTGNANCSGSCQDRVVLELEEWATSSASRLRVGANIGFAGGTWEISRNKEWARFAGIYKPGVNTEWIMPRFNVYTTNGHVWFDDVKITELEVNNNLLVNNGGFELWANTQADTTLTKSSDYSTALGWYAGQYGGIMERSTDAAQGQYSFKLSKSPNSGHSAYVAQQVSLIPGHLYTLSGYVKSKDRMLMHVQQTTGTYKDEFTLYYEGGTTWNKMTANFVPANTTHRIVFETINKENTSIMVDDVKLVDNGLAVSCTTLNECASTETCTANSCMPFTCVAGYHPENHICVVNPITCQSGQFYDATTQSCKNYPTPVVKDNKLIIQIGLISFISLLLFMIYKR